MKDREIDSVAQVSDDPTRNQAAQLRALFPECVSEGKIDFDKLRAALGEEVDSRPERYSFSWAGKRNAIRLLQTPSRATLAPCSEESVNFEETGNVFIEGDNLEVLKLLYKPYFGRVKMIYIDPPYNTGKDFIYPDNFADPLDSYLKLTGQKDSNGNLLTSNPETSGRYHSAWLSMMYPRLFLARQLLREDGVIFVSINDHEIHNLRMIMNEIYGEENFIAQLVWEKTRKNDAKLFSVGHEYIVVYARSLAKLKSLKMIWREPKPGAKEIMEKYHLLRAQYGSDDRAVEEELRKWYQSLPEGHPSKRLSRYKQIDKWGPWRDRDISWPGDGGPTYDVPHPKTKKPCKVPETGWRFATPEAMRRQIELDLVVFREDHTQPPIRKAHLVPVPEELEEEDISHNGNGEEAQEDLAGMQVMPSVIYKQSQVAVKHLRALLGQKLFDNPKDHEVLARLIRYCTSAKTKDIILDFFAGSCSTAEAVLECNRQDGGDRRVILIQLPEPTPENSAARKSGLLTIADLGKERLRRVIGKLKEEDEKKEDLGFKVFKLAESNYKLWAGVGEKAPEVYAETISLYTDPLAPGWKAENVLWEVAVKEGYGLNARIEPVSGIKQNTLYRVTDPDKNQHFYLCLDDQLRLKSLRSLNLTNDDLFICRDAALDDEAAANLALQCRLKTI